MRLLVLEVATNISKNVLPPSSNPQNGGVTFSETLVTPTILHVVIIHITI